MMHTVKTTWTGDMAFRFVADGHEIPVDAAEEFGGQDRGPRPKPLLLAALAGCTGMDVVSILGKMKVLPTYFDIAVEGDLSEDHPKVYTRIRLTYLFRKDDGLEADKVEKAVRLSQEKYCGVSAMLRQVCDLRWEIEYI